MAMVHGRFACARVGCCRTASVKHNNQKVSSLWGDLACSRDRVRNTPEEKKQHKGEKLGRRGETGASNREREGGARGGGVGISTG